jgi:ribosomal protein S18 acetylase RimI-like enzyme
MEEKNTRLHNTEHPLFGKAWGLYRRSFPPDERRQLRSQKKIMLNPVYHFEIITDTDTFIGFILWWDFADLRYIEHFATIPILRGKGYGSRILKKFILRSEKPALLEVEHPDSEIKKRRIGFYERLGFIPNEHDYLQPPYKKGGNCIPLKLLTYPKAISKEDVEHFCKNYHSIVYNVPVYSVI